MDTGKLGAAPEDTDAPITGNGAAPAVPAAPAPAAPAPTAPKLTKKTVSPATGGDCGAFSWTVQWELDRAATRGGWVVQRVDVVRDVKDCAGKPSGPALSGGLDPSWYPLWEAWEIRRGQKVSTYAEGGDVADDTFGSSRQASTKGSLSVKGRAEFYDGLRLPVGFKVTNKAPTWILPATTTDPSLSGGTGSIAHDLTATWDCCGRDKTTKLATV